MLLSLPIAFIIGVLNRIADMVADDGLKLGRYLGWAVGIAYGSLIAYVITQFPLLAELGLAVLLSVLVTGKIDHPVHYMGIASFLFFMAAFGIGPINIALLLVFTVGGAIDEAGNSLTDKRRVPGALRTFFRYRFTMEAVTLVVSAATGIWMLFLAMVSYDAGFTYLFPDSVRRKLLSVCGQ